MTMMCVFGRLMSQLADVNSQSTVGMLQCILLFFWSLPSCI